MKKLITVILTAMLLLATRTYAAGTVEDADKAYRSGNYFQVIKILKPLAFSGHVVAQYNLGIMYDNGKGVAQDYVEAVKWYELAAAQGKDDAQYNLGIMYDNGKGVAQDYVEAVKWYGLAAAQGKGNAQYNLGIKYARGQGVVQDYITAHMWLNLAAIKGDKKYINARDAIANEMSKNQLAESQDLARKCFARKYSDC